MAEQAADVVRAVRELISRIAVVLALDVHPVLTAPSIGLDQTASETSRLLLDDPLLPVAQHDRTGVLLPRTVLWEKTRPERSGDRDVDAVLSANLVHPDGSALGERFDAAPGLLDDLRVGRVHRDPELVAVAVARETAVAQIEAQELGVRSGIQAAKIVFRLPASIAERDSVPKEPRLAGQAAPAPVPHGLIWDSQPRADDGIRQPFPTKGNRLEDFLSEVPTMRCHEHMFASESDSPTDQAADTLAAT